MKNISLSRKGFLASAGTVIASMTVSLASGPVKALADEAGLASDAENGSPTSDDSGSGDKATGIVVVSTNDVHCCLKSKTTNLGYAKLKDFTDARREEYGEGNVVLVDAGDNVQGDVIGSLTRGESPAKAIKSCGYDFMTCGNHEFDYGMEQFFALRSTEGAVSGDSDASGVRYVCCNFVDAAGSRVFDAYRIKECKVAGQAVRVAFVGVATPSTLTSSTPKSFKDAGGNLIYGFCGDESGQALYSAVQSAVDAARGAGDADYVVLLAHLGQKGAQQRWRSDVVVANTHGIDAVVDGHSHEAYVQTAKNDRGEDVVISQTGTKFQSFGQLVIDPFSGTASVSLTATGVAAELIKEWDGSDEEVAALVAGLEEDLKEIAEQEVGYSEHFLRAEEDDGVTWAVRRRETNLADLVADAFFYHATNSGKSCDVALVNGGGVRANLAEGTLTYGDLVSVLTFSNQVCSLEVSGQHLLDMLEVGASSCPAQQGRFLQVSEGFSMTIRTDIQTPIKFSADGSKIESIEGERRVRRAKLYGKAIDPAATYTVVSTDYLLTLGGSAMPIPDNADQVEFMGTDIEALLDYLTVNLKGVIGQAYANQDGCGRIRIVDTWDEQDEEDDSGTGGDGSGSGSGSGGNGAGGNGLVSGSGSDSASGASAANTTGTVVRKSRIGIPATGDETVGAGTLAVAAVLGAGAIAVSEALVD